MCKLLSTQILSVNQEVVNLQNYNVMPYPHSDTVIIEMISYVDGLGDVEDVYLLWCSESQDYVASFVVTGGRAVVIPKIALRIKSNSNMYFKLHAMTSSGVISPVVDGSISITLNFQKYE